MLYGLGGPDGTSEFLHLSCSNKILMASSQFESLVANFKELVYVNGI